MGTQKLGKNPFEICHTLKLCLLYIFDSVLYPEKMNRCEKHNKYGDGGFLNGREKCTTWPDDGVCFNEKAFLVPKFSCQSPFTDFGASTQFQRRKR